MTVKITVEMSDGKGGGIVIPMTEVDKVMRSAMNGIMEKYRGRVDSIKDGDNNNIQYGSTLKVKTMTIWTEE